MFDSAVAESPPFPKGSPKSSVGGTPRWQLSSSARRYGWSPPGYSSVSFMISARAYPPLAEFRSDQAPWTQSSSSSEGVRRHDCVAWMGLSDLVLSRCSKGALLRGEGPRFVGWWCALASSLRECSEPSPLTMLDRSSTICVAYIAGELGTPISYPAFCYMIGRPGRCLFARPLDLGSPGDCLCGGKTPQ